MSDAAFLSDARSGLLAPRISVDVEELSRLWRWDEARVICERPNSLEETPDLPMRVRGAWGRALRDHALMPRRRDPWGRPSAWETLFLFDPPREPGFEAARPYAVRVDVRRDTVEASIRLFGWAGLYVDEALLALWRALEGGVSLRTSGRMRVSFPPIEAHRSRAEGLAAQGVTRHGRLFFDSPTIVRRQRTLAIDPPSILMGAVRRAASLAPWMELGLARNGPRLREACQALTYDMSELLPARWTRWSIRRPGSPIPVNAMVGSMSFHGDIDPIAPYLRLAETCGLGSHAALGFGRVRAVLY